LDTDTPETISTYRLLSRVYKKTPSADSISNKRGADEVCPTWRRNKSRFVTIPEKNLYYPI